MNTGDFKRKLTAIFSADVAGYSRLMGEDEAATVKSLEAYKQVMFSLIRQHRGRVIDSPGDNLLAEFASVVDAVQCGVAVQKELQARNAELPENRRMQFRIGINLGDVIEEQDRIYGDGVNIAARLESCADPGGICVSKTAFDHIETKLPLGYEYLGEKEVKNIAKPVGAYRVLMEPRVTVAGAKEKKPSIPLWRRKGILAGAASVLVVIIGVAVWNFYWRAPKIEPASKEKMAFPLPDKPSIVVLPFTNISEDPKQDVFSDGLTEEIITAISKSPNLFVIARNTAFIYKGKPVKIKQVSEDLGVRYVLEGSVRREGERVRITAQFIDAMRGHHLWSERFDRDLKGILTLQEEIALKITKALHVRLPGGDRGGSTGKGTKNVEAYLKVMEGAQLVFRYTKEDNAVAHKLLEEAIALDPDYARAYSILGLCFLQDVVLGISKSPKQELERAIEMGQKSLALDESDSHANSILAVLYARTRRFDRAIAQAERALALDPNSFSVLNNSGSALMMGGKPDHAIPLLEKAIRLDPFASAVPYAQLSHAYRMVGRYEDALAPARKAMERNPRFLPSQLGLAFGCVLTGHDEEARAAAAEILKINPQFSIEEYTKTLPFKDQSYINRFADALRKAGLPNKPPVEKADPKKMALALPDKPSIAVLPFVNMSDDKSQEYLADGITESIISALSQVPNLFVIARNSTFTYKGKPVKVQQVAEDLGVRYVLEGSVQRSGDSLRITAQLIDAITGHHVWSERYDRELKNIFALQDDITMKVITALQVKLIGGEARLQAKGTQNLEAYLKYLQALAVFNTQTKEGYAEARRLREEVIALDPQYAAAYAALGALHAMEAIQGFSKSPGESLNQALELTKKAIAMDESDAVSHSRLGWLYVFVGRQYDKAIVECERGIDLAPNSAECHIWMSFVLTMAGRAEEAVRYAEQALRLNPYPPSWWIRQLGLSYFFAGRYEEAIAAYKKSLNVSPKDLLTHQHLTTAYSWAGRHEEALAQAAEILRMNPKFSVEERAKFIPLKNQADLDRYLDGLRKAGLK